MSHKYLCELWYKNVFCYQLCLACLGAETRHILKPRIPKMGECCGDSCPNCVWDLYFKERYDYNKQVKDCIKNKCLFFEKKERQSYKDRMDLISGIKPYNYDNYDK